MTLTEMSENLEYNAAAMREAELLLAKDAGYMWRLTPTSEWQNWMYNIPSWSHACSARYIVLAYEAYRSMNAYGQEVERALKEAPVLKEAPAENKETLPKEEPPSLYVVYCEDWGDFMAIEQGPADDLSVQGPFASMKAARGAIKRRQEKYCLDAMGDNDGWDFEEWVLRCPIAYILERKARVDVHMTVRPEIVVQESNG